jgi:hypothetical protein
MDPKSRHPRAGLFGDRRARELLLSFCTVNVIITKGSRKLETKVKCLEDEVMTLGTAIEEAIIRGQKSVAVFSDIPESEVVAAEDFALTCVNTGSGIVGWVDDF